jgi:uncharacterized protein (DUF1697 family)
MKAWVALLRGVNVGGVKVPMAQLKALAEKAGYERVKTYIASGNLLFASSESEAAIQKKLEGLIEQEFGRRIGVLVRSVDELAAVSKANPYAEHPGKWTVAIFVDGPLSLDGLRHQDDEQVTLGKRAVYAWYPSGQARTKLVIPCAKDGTARNMNTVATLAEMAAEMAKEIDG